MFLTGLRERDVGHRQQRLAVTVAGFSIEVSALRARERAWEHPLPERGQTLIAVDEPQCLPGQRDYPEGGLQV